MIINPHYILKVHSVLRDDIHKIITHVSSLYNKKLSLLDMIIQSMPTKRYRLATGNLDGILESFLKDKIIMDEIDAVDYDTSKLISDISNIMGIEIALVIPTLLKIRNPECIGISLVLQKINHSLQEIQNQLGTIVQGMEFRSKGIIEELNSLMLYKKHYGLKYSA